MAPAHPQSLTDPKNPTMPIVYEISDNVGCTPGEYHDHLDSLLSMAGFRVFPGQAQPYAYNEQYRQKRLEVLGPTRYHHVEDDMYRRETASEEFLRFTRVVVEYGLLREEFFYYAVCDHLNIVGSKAPGGAWPVISNEECREEWREVLGDVDDQETPQEQFLRFTSWVVEKDKLLDPFYYHVVWLFLRTVGYKEPGPATRARLRSNNDGE